MANKYNTETYIKSQFHYDVMTSYLNTFTQFGFGLTGPSF